MLNWHVPPTGTSTHTPLQTANWQKVLKWRVAGVVTKGSQAAQRSGPDP